MDVLVDTQIIIWIQEDNPALSQVARKVLANSENQVFVTQISLFEIAIKLKIGKLPDAKVSVDRVIDQAKRDGIRIIQLTEKHINSYGHIPFHDDHRDPFDRLILATHWPNKCPSSRQMRNFSGIRVSYRLSGKPAPTQNRCSGSLPAKPQRKWPTYIPPRSVATT